MNRVAKLAFGTLIMAAIAIVAVCNGQTPRGGGPSYDYQVDFTSDGKTITPSTPVALLSRADQAAHPFQWSIGALPEGTTLEIDIRVQNGRKGPFKRAGGGPMGRYSGGANSKIPAGALEGSGR